MKKNAGETLIEVIAAVSILMIILAPVSALFTSSIRDSAYDRGRLIADSLAVSGLEVMEGLRFTNLLRFSAHGNLCWDAKPACDEGVETPDCFAIGVDCFNSENKLGDGIYRISRDPKNLKWGLESSPSNTPLSLTLDQTADEFFRLYHGENVDLYNHAGIGTVSSFYRQVEISHIGNFAIDVTVTVRMRVGASVRQVVKTKILTPENL